MSKIIFTSHYMRDAPQVQLANYVKYIGTREGVEKIDESKLNFPVTVNQQKLIKRLIRDIPSTKDMLEYNDYCVYPTIGNATVFDFIGRFTIILFYIAPLLIYVSFQLSLTVNIFVSQALMYGATATTITSTVYRIWKVVEQKELVKKVKYNQYICQKLNQ